MDSLPEPLELVAIDPARNIRRRWRVDVTRDLFGRLVVQTGWGRIGTRGQVLTRSFARDDDALRHFATLLARRAGAVRRIGVGYVPVQRDRVDNMCTRLCVDTSSRPKAV